MAWERKVMQLFSGMKVESCYCHKRNMIGREIQCSDHLEKVFLGRWEEKKVQWGTDDWNTRVLLWLGSNSGCCWIIKADMPKHILWYLILCMLMYVYIFGLQMKQYLRLYLFIFFALFWNKGLSQSCLQTVWSLLRPISVYGEPYKNKGLEVNCLQSLSRKYFSLPPHWSWTPSQTGS